MRARIRACLFLAALAVALAVEPAHAMWPFAPRRTSGDTLTVEAWGERFRAWSARPVNLTEEEGTTSLMDSLQAALEAADVSVSPSELAKMAALAAKQQKRPAPSPPQPPQPGSAAAVADSARGAPGPTAERGADDTTTFAAEDDTTRAGFPGEAEDDSLDAEATSATDTSTPSGPFGPRAPTPNLTAAFAGRGVSPSFSSNLRSTNDAMNLSTALSTTVADASGVSLTSTLTYGENLSLTQNTETETRGITNSLLFPVERYGLSFNLNTTNTRSDRLGRGITNARTRNQSDNRGASLSGQAARELATGVRANAFYSHQFTRNEQQIQGTSDASGDRESDVTGNSFGFGGNVSRFRWIQVRGRYGRSGTSNLDRSASFVNDDNPTGEQESTSEGDSATVNVTIPRAGWFTGVSIDLQTQTTQESFTDVARTSTGGIGSETEFALETKNTFSRSLRARSGFSPLSFLSSELSFGVRRDSTGYALRPNQFKDEVRYDWSINSTLTYATGGRITVEYKEDRSDINQDEPSNPRNPQTRERESRSLGASVSQSFTETFKVRLYGDIGLTQEFYRHAGPQGKADRDDLRTRLGLDVDGRISRKATARVQMYVRTFDQAFIDSLRSARSRNETEYVVRPSFTYNIAAGLRLTQLYALSSKILDEIYNPARNTLNRNHSLHTTMTYDMTSRLQLEAAWEYVLQDNGFYVDDPRTRREDRVFAPSARTKKDQVRLSMRYALIQDGVLTFTSENVATREHTGVRIKDVAERGNLALGLDSKIQIGSLSLNTRATRNQSFNVTLNRNVFYNVDSSLSYAF